MASRGQDDRRHSIRRVLAEEGAIRVEALADRLGVTQMTIRRDLAAMEEEGLLLRTHGGCTVQSPMMRELSFSEKDVLRAAQKAAIAREAVRYIEADTSIFIDTGTTCLHVARALPNNLNLRVYTNNLRVAMELFGRDGFSVTLYGGHLAQRSPDLYGEIAISRVQEYRLDTAILGADAIDTLRGEVYGAVPEITNVDRAVLRQSTVALIVADSSKLGKHSRMLLTKLHSGITVITDDEILPDDHQRLTGTKAEIIVARVVDSNGNGFDNRKFRTLAE